jgi:hypothetical protein
MHEAALQADEDPGRLSFLHAVRVIRRHLPRFAAFPPRRRAALHRGVPEEILEERVQSSRGRQNLRGVKRKMSRYPLRPCSPHPTGKVEYVISIQMPK